MSIIHVITIQHLSLVELALTGVSACAACLGIFFAAKRCLPPPPDKADLIFTASCLKDLANAVVVGPLATTALLDMLRDPAAVLPCGDLHLLSLHAPPKAHTALGLT